VEGGDEKVERDKKNKKRVKKKTGEGGRLRKTKD